MDAHLLPGFFSEGPAAWLTRLQSGAGALRIEGLQAGTEPEVVQWLAQVPQGTTRRAEGKARVPGSRALALSCECFGATAGRVLVGLSCADPKSDGTETTFKDVEMALMGVACAALAHEAQGAVIIGDALGPVGAGLAHGTLAEQTQLALDLLGEQVTMVIAAPDTAVSLGVLAGFSAGALGNLTCWTRTP